MQILRGGRGFTGMSATNGRARKPVTEQIFSQSPRQLVSLQEKALGRVCSQCIRCQMIIDVAVDFETCRDANGRRVGLSGGNTDRGCRNDGLA